MPLEQKTSSGLTAAGMVKYRDYGRLELWTGLAPDGSSIYKIFDSASGRALDWTHGVDEDRKISIIVGLAVILNEVVQASGASANFKSQVAASIINLF